MLDARTVVALIAVVFSLLVGTGAIAFYFKYGVRLAVMEENLKQNNLPSMAAKLVLLESLVFELKQGFGKLAQIDTINTKIDQIHAIMNQVIGRGELDARFKAQSDRLETIEHQIQQS